jgi:cyclic-di-GMP phosphodiesterase TipF (flagellum assembly factor)
MVEPTVHAEGYGTPVSEAPLRAAPWDFRPGGHRAPPPLQTTGSDPESGPEQARPAEAAEDESAAIDRILKRLAAQIQSGTDQAARSGRADRNPGSTASGEGVQAAALANAVESLKSAATVMRQSDGAVPAQAATARPPNGVPASPARERLAAVADALARERVDVYLEPILGLADERARHFEVTVRLKQATGDEFDPDEVSQVGRGSGLLPLLDALRVRHSAGLALRLERRGRDGKVFSSITSESLESRQFLAGVTEGRGQGEFVTDRLVLAFEQSLVRAFVPAQWSALAGLRDQGFRFSLQGLTDLDMDFGALKTSGFEFVKLDARVFLQGLPLGQGVVPASDLCRHMAGLGLAVIVGRIDSEAERTRIQGFGVQFGQGGLFGAPRPVNLGTSGAMAGAAA